MRQAVSINLDFNPSNQEVATFISTFKVDLSRCINRFKVNPTFTENEAKQGDLTLFFATNDELNNASFLNKLKENQNKDNVYLILLNPILKPDADNVIFKYHQFRFWDEIVETNEIRLFRNNISESLALYWEKITDIAVEVYDKYAVSETRIFKPKVYLAQTDVAQTSHRDNIKRDLNELGFEVFPEKNLSPIIDECSKEVKEMVADSSLIIHPIPLTYISYFKDSNLSVVEHQCNLTSRYLHDSKENIKRILWIPSEFEITDDDNLIFIEKILRDQEQIHNSKILKVTLEELKKNYRRILSGEDLEESKDNQQLPDVYLIADEDTDSFDNHPIVKQSNGFKVGYNKKGITYNQHLKNLANAQVVVVNYTSDNKDWFTVKVNEILKSPGLNIAKPFKKLILLKGSKDINTCDLDTYFSEVHIGSLNDIKLDFEIKN